MVVDPTLITGLDAGRVATTPNGRCSRPGFAAIAKAAAARSSDAVSSAPMPTCRHGVRIGRDFLQNHRPRFVGMSLANPTRVNARNTERRGDMHRLGLCFVVVLLTTATL